MTTRSTGVLSISDPSGANGGYCSGHRVHVIPLTAAQSTKLRKGAFRITGNDKAGWGENQKGDCFEGFDGEVHAGLELRLRDAAKPDDRGTLLEVGAAAATVSEKVYSGTPLLCFHQQFGLNAEASVPGAWNADTLGLRRQVVRVGDSSLEFVTVESPGVEFVADYDDDWEEAFFFVDADGNVFALEAEDLDDEDPEAGFRLFIADAE